MQDKQNRESKCEILVVDDQPQLLEILGEILVHGGFEVQTAPNGRQALGLLMSSRRFDLIITDMKMPEMDGLELLRRVHQLRPNMPVIVLTGYVSAENHREALREGAAEYLSKPIGVKDLLKAVQRTLKNAHRPNLCIERTDEAQLRGQKSRFGVAN